MEKMWDERYSAPGYAYGTEPNDFLVQVLPRLKQGRALCLGEGEGRNAVYLARHGFEVTAVDQSSVGLEKAKKLAAERGIDVATEVADLERYAIEPASWDLIVAIWVHLPAAVRRGVHQRAVKGLKPGGAFVLEAYTPRQLALGTGGPKSAELLVTLADLKVDLEGLELTHAQELEREIREGELHQGNSAVVQVLGLKR